MFLNTPKTQLRIIIGISRITLHILAQLGHRASFLVEYQNCLENSKAFLFHFETYVFSHTPGGVEVAGLVITASFCNFRENAESSLFALDRALLRR